jgi:hypothetical protein
MGTRLWFEVTGSFRPRGGSGTLEDARKSEEAGAPPGYFTAFNSKS